MRLRHLVHILTVLLVASGTVIIGTAGPALAAPTPLAVTSLPNGFGAIAVDPVTQRVFVSSPTSSVVTVLADDGVALGSVSVPGANSLLVDGNKLYVASTTAGRIDVFDTASLVKVGTYGAATLLKPNALVKAGGKVWTTTGNCASNVQLVSIDPGTGVVATYPSNPELNYCPYLFTSAADPNLILGFDTGLSPATVVRFDVSTGAPVSTASFRTDNSNAKDAAVLPDGQVFALASGSPYEVRTFGINPLQAHGLVYPTGAYPNAVEATAAGGGMVATGRDSSYETDIDVFRADDPSIRLLSYDFGTTSNTLMDRGLAFSPDGARLLAVSGTWNGTATRLNVFELSDRSGRYTPLTPARILDTRTGVGGVPGPVAAQSVVDVRVTGKGGVPTTGVSAVAINVTVTQPTASGALSVFPSGTSPNASNLNFTPGKTIANLVVVKVGGGGKVSMVTTAGTTHVIYDVAGWFSTSSVGADGRYSAVVPARILDTRNGTGGGVRLGPGASLELQVAGKGGVPAAGAAAAAVNVAATSTTATSFLTVYPTGQARPLAANLNFKAGDTVSNRAMVKLGTGGKVTIFNQAGSVDVIVDVGGWYSDATVAGTTGVFTAVTPARFLDTRNSTGGIAGPIAAGSNVDVQVTGQGGVPVGAKAVIFNATVVGPAAGGYLTVSPSGAPRPLAADLNFAAGEIRPNLVVVRLGDGGRVNLFTSAATQVVFDVAGWMS